jgi:hypothetical protein
LLTTLGVSFIIVTFNVHILWNKNKETSFPRKLRETDISFSLPSKGSSRSTRTRTQQAFGSKKSVPSKYAYTWVIGGIDEDHPSYKGFLYDIMISVSLLKQLGSRADYWVLAQMSHNASSHELPPEDVRLLTAQGIKIKLLDKPKKSSFAHLVYEKFRPLQFTQYQRIMFLDADTIPLVNLDYLFHLSDPEYDPNPILRPNLIMATRGEPCNTGMFMMHPEPGAWEELQGIIRRQQEEARALPYPHFDWQIGWGHNFRKEGDQWEAIKWNGTSWRYYAGHSDQGLWYLYVARRAQNICLVAFAPSNTLFPSFSFSQFCQVF